MKGKRVIPRELAHRDVTEAISYYLDKGTQETALAFIDALERAYARISRYPSIGSLRYAHELNIPGLRYRLLARFPHLIFYLDRPDHIDVWRVLHGQRHIPSWMQELS